ncbi:MAG: hypothetical protein ACFFDN_19260 [Candidatus Hodarchaeota archaeon]
MVDLSDFEKETLTWGSRYVKKPWADMIEIFKKLDKTKGELPIEERRVTLEVLPWVEIDMKTVFHLVTFLLYDILKIPNASMFTIILGEKGKRIIWASIEHETDGGVYKDFIVLKDRIDEDWAKKAAELIIDGKEDELFEYLQQWVYEQEELKHIELGIIKIAGIQFFSEFRKAWEASERGRNLEKVIVNVLEALKSVITNDWIKFIPMPYGVPQIFNLIKNRIDLDFQSLRNMFKTVLPNLNMGISILTDNWGTFVKIRHQRKNSKINLEMNQDKADKVFKKGIKLQKFTNKIRKKFKARDVIGLDGAALKNLLIKVMKASSPWDIGKFDKGMGLMLPGVKKYKKYWFYSPEPSFFKGYMRWFARRMGYDYDLKRFSDWWLEELFIFGFFNAFGLQFKIVIFILDEKEKLETTILIHFDNGRLQKIESFSDETTKKLNEIFAIEKDKTEAVSQARFELWEEYGWIKYAMGMKISLLRETIERMLKLRGIFMVFRTLSFYYFIRKFIGDNFYLSPRLPLKAFLKDIGFRDLMKLGKAIFGVLFDHPKVEYPSLQEKGYF